MTRTVKESTPNSTGLLKLDELIEARPFLTERWVRTLVAAKRLKHHKLGGRLLFDPNEIDRLVEEGTVDVKPPRPATRRRKR